MIKMNKKALVYASGLLFAVTMLIFIPDAIQSKIVTNVKPDISAEQLKAIVIEDFENKGDASKWRIDSVPRKLDKAKNQEENPVEFLDLKFIDGKPADLVVENWTANKKGLNAKSCLGIHFKFKYPGYNSVHIIPKEPIKLPGRAKALSMWFHARGHPYRLEYWLQDYRGSVHIIKFGSVNFVGWRPLKAYIPIFIPQKAESYPQTRFLKITRIVIRAEADAITVPTYMFIDQLKVLTDDYEVFFDGQNLDKAFGGKSGKPTETK